ncbi:helix-turn-helix domain-containing protein [Bacillus cereus]|uniref:helix-turn-helix domain-containing protein n=1 Tax=Bacillus cereus TaxID=1396 RepID=UPI000BF2D8AD|nr:helix-turn-helix domain-containing protein [Bacillus cereus]PEV15987.1 hypothetical protein CN407_02490 [Bacillus cereus]PGM64638.1 hypothetical protein CN950_17475 [Bacillus cereus]
MRARTISTYCKDSTRTILDDATAYYHFNLTTPVQSRLRLFRQWIQQYFPNQSLETVLTQEEIACFMGLTRETVNRMLKKDACKDITFFSKMDKEKQT